MPSGLQVWTPKFVHQAYILALLGATNVQVAEALQVHLKTIELWMRTHPEFADALRQGKHIADAEVAHSLYKSAVGYDYDEDVVSTVRGVSTVLRVTKHRPANPWAARQWLMVRRRGTWSEVRTVDITQRNITDINVNLADVTTEDLMVLKRYGLVNTPALNEDNTSIIDTPITDE